MRAAHATPVWRGGKSCCDGLYGSANGIGMSAACFRRIDGMPICWLPLLREVRESARNVQPFVMNHLSLQACPALVGALGCSMVVVGFFVFLYGLPENSVDFLEMFDAFTEFALFSHQHSVASL